VNYIGKDAFSGLTEDMVKLGTGYPTHFSIDNDTITGYIATPPSTLVIPDIPGVNKIQKEAFKNYPSITKIDIKPGIEYVSSTDVRIISNEQILSKKLSQIESAIKTIDLSECPIIMELTKDIVYDQDSSERFENYLPSDDDCVIFFAINPVSKLFKVNYKTNEIVWEKSYESSIAYERILAGKLSFTDMFPDEQNEVFEFKYYKGDHVRKTDFIDTDGKVIIADTSESYQENYISGTSWKVISDNKRIYLEDTNTQKKYLIAHHTESSFLPFTKSKFIKAINSNQFIFESSFSGEGSRHNYYFIYDIDTGHLSSMQSYLSYYLVANKNDEYVTKIFNDFYNSETVYIFNFDINSVEDIRSWTNKFVCINQYAVSKDGRYLALLIADDFTIDSFQTKYENNGIIIIDLEQKKVLVQDELVLSHGSLSFLKDNTLVVNDMKTMIYIDVPSIE
jgi:hypothetical protein